MGRRIKRIWKTVLVVAVVLAAVRMSLPYIIKGYVNRVLNDLPGYTATTADVSISVFRGEYQLHNLRIYKSGAEKQPPFVEIPSAVFGIDWRALRQGAVAGEIQFTEPVLNFIAANASYTHAGASTAMSLRGQAINWMQVLDQLMPLAINHVRVHDGKVNFYDFSTKPKINLFLYSVQLDGQNLQNTKDDPGQLPSRLFVQASSVGNGQLSIIMKVNPMKATPDLDMDMKFESMDLRMLNQFFNAYAGAAVQSGTFNLYSEIAVLDGQVSGYIKPHFENLSLVHEKQGGQGAHRMWASMADYLAEFFGDNRHSQLVTRIPVEGSLTETQTPFIPALWHNLAHAFTEAFERHPTISIASAAPAPASPKQSLLDKQAKDKKELRKDRRKERREKRREKRDQRKAEETNKADKRAARNDSRPQR